MADATDRGRVPFAVVGVLLLVSASTLAATSRTRPTTTAEPAAERALERAESAVVTALRRATAEAARESAARPLTAPADTPAGRVLNGSDPFHAALELRLSLALRDRLRHVGTRVGSGRVEARLPARPEQENESVRAALRRVDVTRVDPNGTALRATVRNVTLVVSRHGRVLDRVRLSPTVVVGVPVFALHDRMERFERRLNRGPLAPGFGRRLTARLYAAAWARGTAQFGGAPVVNVLGTRHVELLANGALHGTQRATLGGVDPDAPVALGSATANVAAADVVSGIEEGLARSNRTETAGLPRSAVERPPTATERVVSIGPAAERELSNLTRSGIDPVLARTYTATARTRAAVERLSRVTTGDGRPGPEWTLVDEHSDVSWSAEAHDVTVTPPDRTTGWHGLAKARRLVVRTETVRARWVRGNRTRVTLRTDRTTYGVGLLHEARPSEAGAAPSRPVERPFDRAASPVGGPNLADAAKDSATRFEGRVDRLAIEAARGGSNGTVRVAGRVPADLHDRVTADLVSLHRRVRNVSVSVERGALATLSVSPTRRLATRLRERRAELVGAPERYTTVAQRARFAVRAAYLDAVLAALDDQAARHQRAERRFGHSLREVGAGGLDRLRRLADARTGRLDTRRPETTGRFGPLRTDVSTAPTYLSTTVAGDRAPPLATRNLNLAVPYADAADTVAALVSGTVSGSDTVRLGTAARTLRSARQVAATTGNESLTVETGRLRVAVDGSVGVVSGRLERTLRRRGVARETRQWAVRAALDRWDTPGARALALSNGSVVPRVVAAVESRSPRFREPARRLALEAALNATRVRALRSARVRVSGARVDPTASRLRRVARAVSREATHRAVASSATRLRERLRGPLGAVPAGVPVTPVPGYWYATMNGWHVEVRGRYERLTLRARTGRPPTGTLGYVRDGESVTLDVDGDGVPERLGRTEHVAFDVSTTVVVAVPPGPRGVGDKDGNADERSDGWPATHVASESGTSVSATNETTYRPPT